MRIMKSLLSHCIGLHIGACESMLYVNIWTFLPLPFIISRTFLRSFAAKFNGMRPLKT